jgi:hypothetical protein
MNPLQVRSRMTLSFLLILVLFCNLQCDESRGSSDKQTAVAFSVCKLYGSDQVKYDFLTAGGYLDESKAQRRAGDYESMKKAWLRDPGPWLK